MFEFVLQASPISFSPAGRLGCCGSAQHSVANVHSAVSKILFWYCVVSLDYVSVSVGCGCQVLGSAIGWCSVFVLVTMALPCIFMVFVM